MKRLHYIITFFLAFTNLVKCADLKLTNEKVSVNNVFFKKNSEYNKDLAIEENVITLHLKDTSENASNPIGEVRYNPYTQKLREHLIKNDKLDLGNTNESKAYVHQLFVDSRYRNKGITKILIIELLHDLVKKGYKSVCWTACPFDDEIEPIGKDENFKDRLTKLVRFYLAFGGKIISNQLMKNKFDIPFELNIGRFNEKAVALIKSKL